MPWTSIIAWLVTYFFSKSQGVSSGKAALLATAAGIGTYYLADPANKENVLGITYPSTGDTSTLPSTGGVDKTVPGSVTQTMPIGSQLISTAGGLLTTGIQEAGSTLKSWGPTGTLGVIAGTTAVSSLAGSKPNWLLIGGIALGAILLLR